jgi:hypothetical protein
MLLMAKGDGLICDERFANMDALKEIARVLKPAGVFGMIWNIDDCKLLPSPGLLDRSSF